MNASIRQKYKNKLNKTKKNEEKVNKNNIYNIITFKLQLLKNINAVNINTNGNISINNLKLSQKLNVDKESKIKFNTNIKNNNTKHKKAKTNIIKKINSFKNVGDIECMNDLLKDRKEKSENNDAENIIKKIKENKKLFDKISYLQLWWKTIFQIIKIQKYLRGFLYRIKLLKMLELKENIVYGVIRLEKIVKNHFCKNIIAFIKDKIVQKKKYYFEMWNNFLTKKIIIHKLKTFDKYKIMKLEKMHHIDKTSKNKNTKKLKSDSIKKRNKDYGHNKDNDENKNKNVFFVEKILELKKAELKTERISTDRNIQNAMGIKNNSIEKRPKKSVKFNTNINNNKRPCKFYKTSSNFLMNKSQNQIKNYKFGSKSNLNNLNQAKLSKKNTNIQKYKQLNKYRNKKMPKGLLDTNLNKFKSYSIESSQNKNKANNNITKNVKPKKNSELEYISTHENRFHCPKQLFSLNKNKNNLKKSSSIDLEKLENSFKNTKDNGIENDKENPECKNDNIRAKSLETRHKKKFKSFVQNVNIKNIKNEDNLQKNLNTMKLPKNEDNKRIMKSKTKVMKKTKKKKKQNQKSILKNSNKISHKFKNKTTLHWLKKWKMKNIKKQIISKLKCISILNNIIKKNLYLKNGFLFIKFLYDIQKMKIISDNFNKYKNIVFTKIILQKLKENRIVKENIKENKDKTNNSIDININDKMEENLNKIKDEKEKEKENNNGIIEKKINIIEISPINDIKIISKIKNNKTKIESKFKLQKLIIIKKRIEENSIKEKLFQKWKISINKFESNKNQDYQNIKDFYFNLKTNNKKEKVNEFDNEHQRINSSYQRKRVKYHPSYLESSFNEEKSYNKKILNNKENNNNNLTTLKKEDYLNKSQPQISNYENFNNFNEYNNSQHRYFISNIFTSPKYDENKNNNVNKNTYININYNYISNSPIQSGIYKKKRIINSKHSNINKNANVNNSCLIGEVNKSNFELNNTMEKEKEFLNNSMVMSKRRIKQNNDIYFPKHINPNMVENETDYKISKIYIKEQPEFYSKIKIENMNNNFDYKKTNIRYQQMYYENDLNSEHKQINFGVLDEQTNEGTNQLI